MTEQPTEKTCTKCGETKPLEGFNRQKDKPDGRESNCRECRKVYREMNRDKILAQKRSHYAKNREEIREKQNQYRETNREEILKSRRERYAVEPQKFLSQNRAHYEKNRDAILERQHRYYAEHREVILEQQRDYYYRTREERLEYARQYRQDNMGAIAEQQRKWREANRDLLRAKRARMAPEKRAKKNAQDRIYRAENPHVLWASNYRSRCSRRGIEAVVEDFTKADVIAKYSDRCAYCETGEFEQLDHYIPVKAGGPHTLENVRPACSACNSAKHDADPEEWLAEQAEFDALTEDEQNALIDAEIAKYLNEED